jgi:hypothetical protein
VSGDEPLKWKNIRDVIVWALAQTLASHNEEQRSKGKAFQSDSAGESPWELACRRLCLRTELHARQSRMDSAPSEAWLRPENLDDDERRFLEKVDTLFNLTTSANEHEAALRFAHALTWHEED